MGVCNESVEEVDDIRNPQGLGVLRRLLLRVGCALWRGEGVGAECGYPISRVVCVSNGTKLKLETRWGLGGECALGI